MGSTGCDLDRPECPPEKAEKVLKKCNEANAHLGEFERLIQMTNFMQQIKKNDYCVDNTIMTKRYDINGSFST